MRLSVSIFLCLSAGLLAGEGYGQTVSPPKGLYVQNGSLMRSGMPYRAMGINYNFCFGRVLGDADNRAFVEGFRILKEEYEIPYIRFMACPFGHQGWSLYADHPEEYFRRMDLIVNEAESRGLGLIPSLFWYVLSVPDFMGEPLNALGDSSSKSRRFIREYTTAMVSRYRESSAIYGWELGNEYMLFADLPQYNHLPPPKTGSNQPRTEADKLLRPMLLDLYKDFHRTVRSIDPDRIIVTGDSISRDKAWHNRNEDRWAPDSRAQWLELFEAETPACYEVVSFHLYEEAEGAYFAKGDLALEGIVAEVVACCRRQNKPIWCGELGMPGTDEQTRTLFFRMIKAVEDHEIELSAIWNFVPVGDYQPDWDIVPQGDRSYMLDAVKELNQRFAMGQRPSLEKDGGGTD